MTDLVDPPGRDLDLALGIAHLPADSILVVLMGGTQAGDVTLLGNDAKKRVGGNSDQFGCHSIPLRRCADTVNVSGES